MGKKLNEDYLDVFDNSVELKTMLQDPYKTEQTDDLNIKPIDVNTPQKTPDAFRDYQRYASCCSYCASSGSS